MGRRSSPEVSGCSVIVILGVVGWFIWMLGHSFYDEYGFNGLINIPLKIIISLAIFAMCMFAIDSLTGGEGGGCAVVFIIIFCLLITSFICDLVFPYINVLVPI